MGRWFGLALMAALVTAMVGGGCSGDTSDQHRYNIVLIVSDALRYDLPGCNGGRVATPNIDALAARGVRFTEAHAAAPWTMPSSVAMITGRQASTLLTDEPGPVAGRSNYKVPSDLETLPRVLQDSGFDLVANIYNPNAWLAGNFQGFRRVEFHGEKGAAISAAQRDSLAELSRILPFNTHSFVQRRLSGFLRFLSEAPPEKPFFAVNWFDDPHAPYYPEPEFLRTVSEPKGKMRRRLRYYVNHTNMHVFDHFKIDSLNTAEVQFFKDLYAAEVASVDERVGLIMAMLKKRGLDRNTIVVFTADHGEGFNEHELFEHGRSYYEELLHVPLIISGPGVPQGVVVESPVSLIDLMPTLSGLLGLSAKEGSQDEGFLKALTGQHYTSGPMYFDSASNLAGNDCRDALSAESFKLITHLTPDRVELYDLQNDPAEKHNLAAVDVERTSQMLEQLQVFRKSCAAQAKIVAGKGAGAADSVSAAERQKVLQKLKSLGYVN